MGVTIRDDVQSRLFGLGATLVAFVMAFVFARELSTVAGAPPMSVSLVAVVFGLVGALIAFGGRILVRRRRAARGRTDERSGLQVLAGYALGLVFFTMIVRLALSGVPSAGLWMLLAGAAMLGGAALGVAVIPYSDWSDVHEG